MSADPDLPDLATMPVERLTAMATLLIQVQASVRAIPDRPGHKAQMIRKRSLELADGLTPEIKRYEAEIARRHSPQPDLICQLRVLRARKHPEFDALAAQGLCLLERDAGASAPIRSAVCGACPGCRAAPRLHLVIDNTK